MEKLSADTINIIKKVASDNKDNTLFNILSILDKEYNIQIHRKTLSKYVDREKRAYNIKAKKPKEYDFYYLCYNGRVKWKKHKVLKAFLETNLTVEQFSRESESYIGRRIDKKILYEMVKTELKGIEEQNIDKLRMTKLLLLSRISSIMLNQLEVQFVIDNMKKGILYTANIMVQQGLKKLNGAEKIESSEKREILNSIQYWEKASKTACEISVLHELVTLKDKIVGNMPFLKDMFDDDKLLVSNVAEEFADKIKIEDAMKLISFDRNSGIS
jgi:hypothetical protein